MTNQHLNHSLEIPPLNIPTILRQADIRPSKGLGQNFLSDPQILQKIVRCADVSRVDQVLEIGPGLGSLTRHLAGQAKAVTAVEIDKKLFPILTDIMKPFQNVRLVEGDILEIDPADLMEASGYIVAANIPYNITSAIIRHLLESPRKPARIILTIQQEVASRICAKPGDMSLLALSVQVFGKPKIEFRIPAGAFYPPPNVDSAVIRIDLYDNPVIPVNMLDKFFQVIRAGFAQKRKTLRNSLSHGLNKPVAAISSWLTNSNINPDRRAETLSLQEWKSLIESY
jgi:16S rRNA (adenine1518-N6/adenine1519-N6)-dimethyltransferase